MAEDGYVRCRVTGGERLPAESGGSAALCAAIENAMATRLPGMDCNADIAVMSPTRLACRLTVEGRELPEQQQSSVDRPLMRSTFERFAKGLAEQAAELLGR